MPENKETVVKLEKTGTLHIAEDVIMSIAALAAAEVEGVASLAGSSGNVADVITKKGAQRGIKLSFENDAVNIDVTVMVSYGHPVLSVCNKIQDAVENAIATMTGINVGRINIHVAGIAFEKNK